MVPAVGAAVVLLIFMLLFRPSVDPKMEMPLPDAAPDPLPL
jgi:hypothetical protein